MSEIMNPDEVAELLHASRSRLANLRYLGTGPKYVKVGRKVLYRRADVMAWLDANTMQRTDDPKPAA